jgi:hypothetical protein
MFGYDLNNLIPIKSYYGGTNDNELLNRLDIVDGFFSSPYTDVRDYLKPIFGLHSTMKAAQAESLAALESFLSWLD